MEDNKHHIVVLGAGISGLQTAFSLLQHGHTVTIIAAHTPGDFATEYTSPWAGGHWRSHVGNGGARDEERLRGIDARTYRAWTSMLEPHSSNLEREKEKEVGLGFRNCRYYWGKDSAETKGGDGAPFGSGRRFLSSRVWI